MKVKDLMAKLRQFNPEAELLHNYIDEDGIGSISLPVNAAFGCIVTQLYGPRVTNDPAFWSTCKWVLLSTSDEKPRDK